MLGGDGIGSAAMSLSTHVLDTARGAPARGVRVELHRGDVLLSAHETDADGRVANLAPDGLEGGSYRLVFHPLSAFFARVELEIVVDDPGRHYHVPLLVSDYSCASYRGS
jgi:5-hydroxyisourate hydrolase